MLEFECDRWQSGDTRLAGLDEAGRGPLAGPVVAATLTAPRDLLEAGIDGELSLLTDSKKLTEKRRDSFFELLTATDGIEFGVGVASVAEIDELNILRATHLAMRRSVEALEPLPDHVLVDGLAVDGLPVGSTPIVKGDSKSLLIAGASVIAKVTRDRMMKELHEAYPVYGFAGHKGYGSKAHIEALMKHGPCPEHRQTFRPVREARKIREWIEEHPEPN